MRLRGPAVNAGDICNRSPVRVGAGATLADAAALMREHRVGTLVVVSPDADKTPLGILGERDLALSIAGDCDPRTLAVVNVMGQSTHTVSEDESIRDVLALMRRHGIGAVPVVTHAGGLAGVVTIDGFLDLLAEQLTDMMVAIERGRDGDAGSAKPRAD